MIATFSYTDRQLEKLAAALRTFQDEDCDKLAEQLESEVESRHYCREKDRLRGVPVLEPIHRPAPFRDRYRPATAR